MQTKYHEIYSLAGETTKRVTANGQEWMKYLATAARIYKFPFEDQILIYAQKPEATACASIKIWNEKMFCWVNRGAKGIALIDAERDWPVLHYVFDVSDVHPSKRIGRKPYLWKMETEHEDVVLKQLEKTYGETEGSLSFEGRIMELAMRIAGDYCEDLMPEIDDVKEGSYLEELDELNVEIRLRDTLSSSIAYTLLSRCGADMETWAEELNFEYISDFSTPKIISVLGSAIVTPYIDVLLSWKVVEKRIRKLVTQDRYLSPEGKEEYARYQEEQVQKRLEAEKERLEYQTKIACKEAVEKAIADHFDGYHLADHSETDVIQEFGAERVSYVLAYTVSCLSHDGRFSKENKEWAKGIEPKGYGHADLFISSHPAVLDGRKISTGMSIKAKKGYAYLLRLHTKSKRNGRESILCRDCRC